MDLIRIASDPEHAKDLLKRAHEKLVTIQNYGFLDNQFGISLAIQSISQSWTETMGAQW